MCNLRRNQNNVPMLATLKKRWGCLAVLLMAMAVRADYWNYWGAVAFAGQYTAPGDQLASDGTNLYYATELNGIWCASLADGNFSAMPMTGYPLWDANTNTNGFVVASIAATPQGALVICGAPVSISVVSNNVDVAGNSPAALTNTLPVFYWWDGTNQLWHAATVAGKSYPYTANVGKFSIAPDGSVWACSGYYGFAYHSTDGGHSYTAFDVSARVPANYSPQPFTANSFSTGKISSIVAGPDNEVVIGTETGGYLHTTNNGQTWASLDPNFTSTTSQNPLGRIADAVIFGFDAQGDFLCGGGTFPGGFPASAYSTWTGVPLIGWHPADGSRFAATNGFPPFKGIGPATIHTTACGVSFMYLDQNYLLQGGIYYSFDGTNWTQFNDGLANLTTPFAMGLTNAVGKGDCITTVGNLVFVGGGYDGNLGADLIYEYDSSLLTPPPPPPTVTNRLPALPPITNRPPVALAQNLTLSENKPANFVLSGYDADGDALNFTVTTEPRQGALTGTPPALTYTPSNNITGLDSFYFAVDDGIATSAPVPVNVQINATGTLTPTVSLHGSATQPWLLAGASLTLSTTAADAAGIHQVNLYNGTSKLILGLPAPYVYTVTNLAAGNYIFNARATDTQEGSAWAAPLVITVLPVAPELSIQMADPADVAVSWPLALTGFFVETSATPEGPWSLSPEPPVAGATSQTATIPLTGAQFFRLMQP